MKKPDEIKKGLECCKPIWKGDHWKNCDEKCPYSAETSWCKTILNQDTLAYIQQLEAARMKWISTKERLPEESGQVLIGVLGISKERFCHIANVEYSSVHKRFNVYDWMDEKEISGYMPDYWMPLPEPPKEGI